MDAYGNLSSLDMITTMSFALTVHNVELAEVGHKSLQDILKRQDLIFNKLDKIERMINNGND